MQFITVALSLFVAVAAAQTNSTSDSLPDLIAQLPTCALDCFDLAATSADCTTTDFDCICSKKEFVTSIGACVLLGNSCSQEDISTATDLANRICTDVRNNPDPSEVAEASNLVTSALATISPTSTPDAAARPDIAFGMVGAGFLAALAL